MHKLHSKLHRKKQELSETRNKLKKTIKNEHAAIDLASIMVGIIVIGLIGGVIAATVFAVIPWSQDNAAKHQLDSIVQAENAYFGLSAAVPSPLPSGSPTNSFANSNVLASASLLSPGKTYCAVTTDEGKGYQGFSQSASGKVWTVSNKNSKPEVFNSTDHGSFPSDCNFITVGFEGVESDNPSDPDEDAPYIDPTPTETRLTYKCDTPVGNAALPMSNSSVDNYSVLWSDGSIQKTRHIEAGKEYTVVIMGTYNSFNGGNLSKCLRSVDHWGSDTGVTNVTNAFSGASNLTNVPENVPTTITNAQNMFKGATSFNDPNISKWDVSSVTNMTSMFDGATSFNQPLNSWNVSSVITMNSMFRGSAVFDNPLEAWNVSNVTDMVQMFDGATSFSQDLGSWDTSSVQRMAFMFSDPFAMKNNVKHNTYSKTTTLTYKCDIAIFRGTIPVPLIASSGLSTTWNDGDTGRSKQFEAGKEYIVVLEGKYSNFNGGDLSNCLRSVDHWGSDTGVTNATNAFSGATNLTNVPENVPTTITNAQNMFKGATSFNDPDISKWDVSSITNMTSMFDGATSFNQPLNSWDVSNVITMNSMFQGSSAFDNPLEAWNVSNVTDMAQMFDGAISFNNDLGSWDTSNVQRMAFMFGDPFAMKNNVKHNTYSKTTTLTYKCDIAIYRGTIPVVLNGSSGLFTTWNDGDTVRDKKFEAGKEYIVILEGKYSNFNGGDLSKCLRSVDHWGSDTGVTNATNAFSGATNLTNVPENVPTTITNAQNMFKGATSFNDPDVSKWDVSSVTNMNAMFDGATSFNQPLNSWNVSKVTTANNMFARATNFNQSLDTWNVSNVTDMAQMFDGATSFSQDLGSWDTSNVQRMAFMFSDPFAMKNNVKHNTYSRTTTLTYKCDIATTGDIPIVLNGSIGLFTTWSDGTTARSKKLEIGKEYIVILEGKYSNFNGGNLSKCLRSVDHWGSDTGVTNAFSAFSGATNLTNVPENVPTTIISTQNMFKGATSFNDPDVSKWDVSNVINMTSMFDGSTSFNQDLSGWNTAALTQGTMFAPTSFPDAFMPSKTSK